MALSGKAVRSKEVYIQIEDNRGKRLIETIVAMECDGGRSLTSKLLLALGGQPPDDPWERRLIGMASGFIEFETSREELVGNLVEFKNDIAAAIGRAVIDSRADDAARLISLNLCALGLLEDFEHGPQEIHPEVAGFLSMFDLE